MRVPVNGFQMAFEMRGNGRPVLLIHGYPLNRSMWQAQIDALSAHYLVIAPDLRGHGGSDAPAGDYSMDLFADDLVALLNLAVVSRAVVVGFSMGGYIALALQRRYRSRIEGLVLASTKAGPDSPDQKANREKTIGAVKEKGTEAIARDLVPNLLAQGVPDNDPELARRVKDILTSTPVKGYVGDLTAMIQRPDSEPTLKTIQVPTLIMVGDQDRMTPVAESEKMAGAVDGAKLVVIPNAGHLTPIEQPEAFNKALLDFLGSIP